MPDRLLLHVPRYVEIEPGYRSTELLRDRRGWAIGTLGDGVVGSAIEKAMLEPVSGRWMPGPLAVQSEDEASDWSATDTTVALVQPEGLGGGVQVVSEGDDETPWSLRRIADLTPGRGYYVDLFLFPPEDVDAVDQQQFSLSWGGGVSGGAGAFRVTLRSNQKFARWGLVEQLVASGDTAQWHSVVAPLLGGDFYQRVHRLWLQPLSADEWLIANRDEPERGLVVRSRAPTLWLPDGAEEGQEIGAPWGVGGFILTGVSRAWIVVRDLVYYREWTMSTDPVRDIGYAARQGVTATVRAFVPDQLPQGQDPEDGGTSYPVTVTVRRDSESGDEWPAAMPDDDPGSRFFHAAVAASAPDDADGYTTKAIVLDRIELEWPNRIASDGLAPIDLLAEPGLAVTDIRESRGRDDWQSYLSCSLWGELEAIDSLYLRPNSRLQWQLYQGLDEYEQPIYYTRFDGLIDGPAFAPWPTTAGTWKTPVQLTARSRWKQAAEILYRGGIGLDGIDRSEAYQALARQMVLKTEWTEAEAGLSEDVRPPLELAIGDLDDDGPLPEAGAGERPALLPRTGTSILRAFQDVLRGFGPRDRAQFREGVLHIDQPSDTPAVTLYHTSAEAASAGVPTQYLAGADRRACWQTETTDDGFVNEIILVGGKDGNGELLAWYWNDPPSWNAPVVIVGGLPVDNPRYIGVRRTLILVRPELRTEADLARAGYALWRAFYRFQFGGALQGWLLPTVYPGDTIRLAVGNKPAGYGSIDYVVEGMRTVAGHQNLPAARRHRTTYLVRVA